MGGFRCITPLEMCQVQSRCRDDCRIFESYFRIHWPAGRMACRRPAKANTKRCVCRPTDKISRLSAIAQMAAHILSQVEFLQLAYTHTRARAPLATPYHCKCGMSFRVLRLRVSLSWHTYICVTNGRLSDDAVHHNRFS